MDESGTIEHSPELGKLAQYVAQHPEDHDRRWLLVKHLHKRWENRQAVEHLLVLRDAWPSEAKVVRYLAAVYYRLGKLDDAIEALEACVDLTDNKEPIFKTIAKFHERQGRCADAMEAWERVLAHSDSNEARDALARLQAMPEHVEVEADSVPVGTLLPEEGLGEPCEFCGEPRDLAADVCWRCHAVVYAEEEMIEPVHVAAPQVGTRVWTVFGMSAAALIPIAAVLLWWVSAL